MAMPSQRGAFVRRRARRENDQLLQEIADFCRRSGMAESTFGRRAVNDGKFVARLRFGGGVTTHTVKRLRTFMSRAEHAMREDVPVASRQAVARPGAVNFASAVQRFQAMKTAEVSAIRPGSSAASVE